MQCPFSVIEISSATLVCEEGSGGMNVALATGSQTFSVLVSLAYAFMALVRHGTERGAHTHAVVGMNS